MKKCPNCKRSYSDESLNFCLDDGTVLVEVKEAATDENIQRSTNQKTEILPHDKVTKAIPTDKETQDYHNEKETVVRSEPSAHGSQPQIIKQGVSPMFAYLSVGLLTLLVVLAGVGVALWINSNSADESRPEFAKNMSDEEYEELKLRDAENVSANDGRKEATTKKTPKKETKATPKKEDDKETPKPTPAESASPTPTPDATPEPEKGRFFVILGSYKDPANAKRRLQLARSKGLPARIINTSNVPGLRSGLQAVVMGPFSKSAAKKALGRAKTIAPDAYVKSG